MTAEQTIAAVFGAGVCAWLVYRVWYMRRRAERSLRWPMVRAEIVSSDIVERDEGEHRVVVLRLSFSYTVTGQIFGGAYEESPGSRQLAEHMQRVYRDGPFLVRHNPVDPSDYFVDPYRDVRLS